MTRTISRPFHDADYAAIEARIVNFLAGQEDALEEYRQGVDRYKRMAAVIYGIPEEQVNKHPQRFIGKQAILLCGFQGGAPKFRQTCQKFGYKDMPTGLEDMAVGKFRKQHDCIVKYWHAVEEAAKKAIKNKGQVFAPVPEYRWDDDRTKPLPKFRDVRFMVKNLGGMEFLLLRLPSGRKLSYPQPKLMKEFRKGKGGEFVLDRRGNKIIDEKIYFYGNTVGVNYGDVGTYAGKLVENITQAVAADLMANGAHNAERAGYEIATLIHDQALAYTEDWQTSDEFVRLLTDMPAWAEGLPLAAEGGLVPYYRKD